MFRSCLHCAEDHATLWHRFRSEMSETCKPLLSLSPCTFPAIPYIVVNMTTVTTWPWHNRTHSTLYCFIISYRCVISKKSIGEPRLFKMVYNVNKKRNDEEILALKFKIKIMKYFFLNKYFIQQLNIKMNLEKEKFTFNYKGNKLWSKFNP